MYLSNELKYFNRFMFIVSRSDMHQFLFAFESISLKVAFKMSLSEVHLGETFNVKYKMWDKFQNI